MTTLAALISGDGLIRAVIVLLIVGVILGLVVWLVGKSPLPEPFKSVLTWIVYAAGVLILINFLLSLIGHGFISF
jgi:hypothetical protein